MVIMLGNVHLRDTGKSIPHPRNSTDKKCNRFKYMAYMTGTASSTEFLSGIAEPSRAETVSMTTDGGA